MQWFSLFLTTVVVTILCSITLGNGAIHSYPKRLKIQCHDQENDILPYQDDADLSVV